jgi:hypothetical protein
MPKLSWTDAITKVLQDAREPLHYQEITSRILSSGLKTTEGATPYATVNAQIAASIKHDGEQSPYVRVSKGIFTLRQPSAVLPPEDDLSDEIVHAFGMYWQRDLVVWRRQPVLFGRQQAGARAVDFADQRGIYIRYDHHTIIYVGRSVDRPLGQRLYEHTLDRLSGRWNRFSWFGLYEVTDAGKLRPLDSRPSLAALTATLEALLIETLEPPQNRKRGDDFTAIEYIQDLDPELRERQIQHTLRTLEQKLRDTQT